VRRNNAEREAYRRRDFAKPKPETEQQQGSDQAERELGLAEQALDHVRRELEQELDPETSQDKRS
jgi:hypothetical protein